MVLSMTVLMSSLVIDCKELCCKEQWLLKLLKMNGNMDF